jgi:uncharacterized damage-inducible protein DinB
MACNNAWANHRLLEAVAALSPAERVAPRTGFFGSVAATLDHILNVDRMYVDAVERALRGDDPHPDPSSFFVPAPGTEVGEAGLATAQRAIDRRLMQACAGLSAEALSRSVRIRRGERMQVEAMPRLLAHLFQHQIHHRGQVHAMLSGTGVSPPQLDEFFSAAEAPLRAADLAAIGLSEEAIWERRGPGTPDGPEVDGGGPGPPAR